MKNKVSVYFLFLITILLASCTGEVLTSEDDGSRVEYSIGSEFKVTLKGDPEGGFVWKTVGLNQDVVKQIGEPVIETSAETGEDFGTYTFTFETVSAGSVVLRLIYYDKNAEDPEPEAEFSVEIISGTIGRIES